MHKVFWDFCMMGFEEFTHKKIMKLNECSLTYTRETLKIIQNIEERVLEL
jgi:hypothetical protein